MRAIVVRPEGRVRGTLYVIGSSVESPSRIVISPIESLNSLTPGIAVIVYPPWWMPRGGTIAMGEVATEPGSTGAPSTRAVPGTPRRSRESVGARNAPCPRTRWGRASSARTPSARRMLHRHSERQVPRVRSSGEVGLRNVVVVAEQCAQEDRDGRIAGPAHDRLQHAVDEARPSRSVEAPLKIRDG